MIERRKKKRRQKGFLVPKLPLKRKMDFVCLAIRLLTLVDFRLFAFFCLTPTRLPCFRDLGYDFFFVFGAKWSQNPLGRTAVMNCQHSEIGLEETGVLTKTEKTKAYRVDLYQMESQLLLVSPLPLQYA